MVARFDNHEEHDAREEMEEHEEIEEKEELEGRVADGRIGGKIIASGPPWWLSRVTELWKIRLVLR
jgi:hypothetical protein